MLKALLIKQLRELGTAYVQDKKTGGKRSKGQIILLCVVYLFALCSLGFVFFNMAAQLCGPLVAAGMGWLYYAIMAMLGLFFGIFGSVFNAYSGMYRAKDNDLLLSMPIPPSYVLLSRIMGIVLMSLLFEGVVMIPTLIARCIAAPAGPAVIICDVLLILLIALLATVLSCLLGWVVALIATRLKSKNILTVFFSLAFFALYYYFFARSYTLLESLLQNSEAVGNTVRRGLYPFYQMGMAGEGNILSLLIVAAGILVLFLLTWYILSRSFHKIVTIRQNTKKAVYKEQPVKAAGVKSALRRRELKRFLSSSTYMLNCGLGTVFMLLVAGFVLVRMGWLRQVIDGFTAQFPTVGTLMPLFIAAIVCLMTCLNIITAPSVSLEGSSIWQIQSLPVRAAEVLRAKLEVHWLLTLPPALLAAAALCFVLRIPLAEALPICVTVALFVMLLAAAGLALNLRMPNLHWTEESVAVKQGLPVIITIFGGGGFVLVLAAIYFLLHKLLTPSQYLLVCIVLLALGVRLLHRWLGKKGSVIFADL